MTDTSAQEPTMEEILASIRRIISEDDSGETAAEAEPVASETTPTSLSQPPVPTVAGGSSDVLDLTDPVMEPSSVAPVPAAPFSPPVLDDIEIVERAPPVQAPVSVAVEPEDGLLSDRVAEAAAGHFGSLSHSLLMPAEGRTLEDVVKELLRPLLKTWLDAHLAGIVEAKVQSEVERISRRRV